MKTKDLETARKLDFARVDLDYEGFRALARNENLTPNERIGFPESYRAQYTQAILSDILAKLPAFSEEGSHIIDIGPGCGELAQAIIEKSANLQLVLVDSEDMLAHLPDAKNITKVAGSFPANMAQVQQACPQADAILCYSVMHYIYLEANPFDIIDHFCALLKPGGAALIGDIPNASKRRRFFASESGKAFHRAFTGRSDEPQEQEASVGRIDDAVLSALIARAQSAGCDAYLLPQGEGLPMANRRDDLLIRKP